MKNFIIILYILLSSCSQNNNNVNNMNGNKIEDEIIKSISISTYGGEMGYYQSLKLTADSLYYNFDLAVDSTKRRSEIKVNRHYKLEDIVNSNQLINFVKIKNGESRQRVDGTDTKIEIKTNKNTHAVINRESNNSWQNIEIVISKILNDEFTRE
jgi:hypothetical protein